MTQVFVNRAFVYTATTGTGTITLGSAVSGYRTFADAGVADTNTVRYLIIDDSAAWEIGTGTYTASGATLARSVEESSNSDALLNLTGNATVAVIVDATDITSLLSNLFENPLFLRERSAATTDQAAYGQLWVKNSTPNELWFTDDAGNDYRVSSQEVSDLGVTAFSAGDVLYHDGTNLQRLAKGTEGQVLRMNDGATAPAWGNVPVLHVREEQPSGTSGTASVNGWTRYLLNTTPTNEISGASVASEQVTLPAGTYEADISGVFSFPFNGVTLAKIRLRNITDSTTALVGMGIRAPTYSNDGLSTSSEMEMRGRFTIAGEKVFEVQAYSTGAGGTLGSAVSSGEVEVFTDAMFRRIA